MLFTGIATEDFYTLDQYDILSDPQSGLPQVNWIRQPVVKNVVDFFYNFNDPAFRAGDYGTRQVYTADASLTKFGADPALELTCRGIRTSLGGQAIMDALALNFLQRWGYAPWLMRVNVTYRRHIFEVLDSVRVTHPLIENPITGLRGLRKEQFEVIDLTPMWGIEGKLSLLLLWTGAIETSAAPTSTGELSLVPGLGSTDETDVPVPFAGSADVTSGAGTRKLIVGLKHRSYRTWECLFNIQALGGDPKAPTCQAAGQSYVDRAYTSQVQYRMEYKTSAAPDSPGSGGNPTTGWVQLKASSTRGSVALFDEKKCFATPQTPLAPDEDFWSEAFEVLGGSPAIYNVRVFFEALAAQGDPCPGLPTDYCSSGGCPGSLASSVQTTDAAALTVDYLTSIT